MKRIFQMRGWLLGLSLLALPAAGTDELRQVWSVISERTIPEQAPKRDNIAALRRKMTPEGAFPDVDYANTAGDRWLAGEHLARLRAMARAYRRSDAGDRDPALLEDIRRGLAYWCRRKPVSSNWWMQQIGTPIAMSDLFFLLGDAVTPELLTAAAPIFDRASFDPKSTGQNRNWMARVLMYKGIFYGNAAQVAQGRDILMATICPAGPGQEGIQPDYSFHQHGPQLQFGNYGRHFLVGNLELAQLLAGTPLAMPRKKTDLLLEYFLQGPRYVVWGDHFDLNACGRYVGKETEKRMLDEHVKAAKMLLKLYPEQRELRDFLDGRTRFAATKYFDCSAFLVHRRHDYYVSLRMCSGTVVGSETVGTENLKGRMMGNGMMQIRRDNHEYEDIAPFWNWRQLPGITAPQQGDDTELRCPGCWKREAFYNATGTAGGLTDGEHAAVMMALRHGKFTANKSAFFFDRYFVCIGSGISGGSATTVNSCRLRGEVHSSGSGDRIESVRHDNVEYLFPGGAPVKIDASERTGRWSEVIGYLPQKQVSEKLFTLTLEHSGDQASYCYWVRPVADDGAVPQWSRLSADSPDIHAVHDRETDLVMAAFYVPGKIRLPAGGFLESAQPALIMLKDGKLTAADPSRQATRLQGRLNGAVWSKTMKDGKEWQNR